MQRLQSSAYTAFAMAIVANACFLFSVIWPALGILDDYDLTVGIGLFISTVILVLVSTIMCFVAWRRKLFGRLLGVTLTLDVICFCLVVGALFLTLA